MSTNIFSYLYRKGTVLAQSPASCSDTRSTRDDIALVGDEVGTPSVSELSNSSSNFTAATSFASSSEGEEFG